MAEHRLPEPLRVPVYPDRGSHDGRLLHRLKCWPEYLELVRRTDGKPYEIRKADRDYRKGDILVLEGWDPLTGEYTGVRPVVRRVTHMTAGGEWGLPEGICVLGLESEVEHVTRCSSCGCLRVPNQLDARAVCAPCRGRT